MRFLTVGRCWIDFLILINEFLGLGEVAPIDHKKPVSVKTTYHDLASSRLIFPENGLAVYTLATSD